MLKDCIPFRRFLKMSGTACPLTHCYILEDLSLSTTGVRTWNLALYLMFLLILPYIWRKNPYRNQTILFTLLNLQTVILHYFCILFYYKLTRICTHLYCITLADSSMNYLLRVLYKCKMVV